VRKACCAGRTAQCGSRRFKRQCAATANRASNRVRRRCERSVVCVKMSQRRKERSVKGSVCGTNQVLRNPQRGSGGGRLTKRVYGRHKEGQPTRRRGRQCGTIRVCGVRACVTGARVRAVRGVH